MIINNDTFINIILQRIALFQLIYVSMNHEYWIFSSLLMEYAHIIDV